MTMPANELDDPKLAALLSLATRNFKIFPVWGVFTDGNCRCGNAKCSSPGKHPIGSLVPKGVLDATFREDQIKEWHNRAPSANWAIATGERLIAIDVDRKNGFDGEEGIKALEAELGQLPFTLRTNTPTTGYHLFFETELEIRNSASRLAKNVDIRGVGGYVLCFPSVVKAGAYQWDDDSLAIEKLPEAWGQRLASEQKATEKTSRATTGGMPDAVIGEGGRNQFLFKLGCTLRGAGGTHSGIFAYLLTENQNRCYPPLDEAEVKAIAESVVRYEAPPPPPDNATAEPPPEAHHVNAGRTDDWKQLLDSTKNGPKNTIANVVTILSNDPEWEGVLAYDEFLESPVFLKPPPFSLDYSGGRSIGELEDADDGRIATWLGRSWKVSPGISTVMTAVITVSKNHPVHPVREYLKGIRWDGTERISTWLSDYLGVKPSKIIQQVGRWFFISMVARVFRPGCQVDTVTIFEGIQGILKSSLLRKIGGQWYTDELPNIRDAQAVGQNLRGVWLCELAELASVMNHSHETIKRVLSQREDRYRPSYGRRVRAFPRQCIFAGTTNRDDYLSDPTGHRRWIPVRVNRVDLAALERDRDQLFAEAYEAFLSGGVWWAQDDEEKKALAARAKSREAGDAWTPAIVDYLNSERIQSRLLQRSEDRDGYECAYITSAEILSECLKLDPGRWGKGEQMRVGDCIRQLGWRRGQLGIGKGRFWAYLPPLAEGQIE